MLQTGRYPLNLEDLSEKVRSFLSRGQILEADDLLTMDLYIHKNEVGIRDLGQLVAKACVDEVMVREGTSRYLISPGDPTYSPLTLLECAQKIYGILDIDKNSELNEISQSARRALKEGKLNLARKFAKITRLDFCDEDYMEAGNKAFERGWVHQGIEAYHYAHTEPTYDLIAQAIFVAFDKVSSLKLPTTQKAGESSDRYLSEIKKGLKYIQISYPQEFGMDIHRFEQFMRLDINY